MNRPRAAATVVLVAIVVACTSFVARKAALQTAMTPDEATTIVAARAILKHGVPELPSHRIYWRSPVSHYLDALSTAILGDREIGWRGASVVAFAVTLLLPGLMLLRRGHALLALTWPILIALMPPVQWIAPSARMYMVYTCMVCVAVTLAVFRRPQRFDRTGIAYVVCCGAAALSHQHFVLFVPGLFLVALLDWAARPPRSARRRLRSPMVIAPLVGLGLALGLHLSENRILPRAFANEASMPTRMGAHASFGYPLDVAGTALPVPALALAGLFVAVVIARRRRPGDNSLTPPLVVVLITAYVGLALTLPNRFDYYVSPLLPIFLLALFSLAIVAPDAPPTSRATLVPVAVLVAATALIRLAHTPSPLPGIGPRWKSLVALPPLRDRAVWRLLGRWVAAHDAVVLTSEPEFALLRFGRVDYHVRNWGVRAHDDCERIVDDGFAVPYAHSPCQLEEVVRRCDGAGGSALFVGARLGRSIAAPSTSYIRGRFEHVGMFEEAEEIYCYGHGCTDLAADLARVHE